MPPKPDPRAEPSPRPGYVTCEEFDRTIAELKAERAESPVQHPYRSPAAASLPPPRNQMDTGKYEIHIQDLEKALRITQSEFRDYKEGRLENENRELKERGRWWADHGIRVAIAAVGFAVTTAITWVIAKLTK